MTNKQTTVALEALKKIAEFDLYGNGVNQYKMRSIAIAAISAMEPVQEKSIPGNAHDDLIDSLKKICALSGTETNEWDAAERIIPEMAKIAHDALAKVGAS